MSLPKRKCIRLRDYDYSSNGAYFITVCVNKRRELLWKSVGADIIRQKNDFYDNENTGIILSAYGKIIEKAIGDIPEFYPNIEVDKFCIMPNHIHMILLIYNEAVGDKITFPEGGRIISAPTISTVIGQMKRSVSKQVGFSIWQKSFYDHIIRNEKEYREIWQYIDENPIKWDEDLLNSKAKAILGHM